MPIDMANYLTGDWGPFERLDEEAMIEKQRHTHKLRRHKYKTGNTVYFCILPDCSYKIAMALALGKRNLCNRCNEEFIMNEYSVRLAKPHCEKCHQPKNKDNVIFSKESTISLEPLENVEDRYIGGPIPEMTLQERLAKVIQDAQIHGHEEEEGEI